MAKLLARDYVPRSQLVVPKHLVARSACPAIDAHNHLPFTDPRMREVDLEQLVREMDMLNIQAIVNLSGGSGDTLRANLNGLDNAFPGRFCTFCNVDWEGAGGDGWLDRTLSALEADAAAGAHGLKVFKSLGLRFHDAQGKLLMPDDPRIAPVWERAGQLGLPVLIHTADPVAFFQPLDRFNERWDELHAHPDWHFYGPDYPEFDELIASLYRLVEAHPQTIFITAHVGCYPENLAFVSAMMDRYDNLYTDFSARISELGRMPYSARDWFVKHADRIVFGTDIRPTIDMYRIHFRFLETADEYFCYSPGEGLPGQGRWRIYGVDLPNDVLQRVYHDNAARLLGLDES